MIVSEAEQSEGRDRRGRSSSTLRGEIIKHLALMSFDFYMKQIVCTNPPCECAQERPSTYKRLTQGRGADSLASPLSQLPPVESESENLNLKYII